jgi:hypothetical protein
MERNRDGDLRDFMHECKEIIKNSHMYRIRE